MDLPQDYGRLTLTQLQIPVMAYQAAMDHHAQNDYQLYFALTNLVDKDTKGKIQREKSDFMMGVAGDIPSRMLYFQKLLMKAEVDSRAMASHIRDNLGSLDMYMQNTANSKISDFNDYIRNQMTALSDCKDTTHNLLKNLLKAHAKPECEELAVYKPEMLMNECQDKYSCLLLLT
jgi:hypothetical protein